MDIRLKSVNLLMICKFVPENEMKAISSSATFTLLLLLLPVIGTAQPSDDPASVLLIVNDATVPEPGTGKMKASQYVANYYAQARRIPKSNIFHINYRMGCCSSYATLSDSWTISWKDFDERIRQPLKKFLEEKQLKDKIRYIVPTYGVPSHLTQPVAGLSVDTFLAALYSPQADRTLSQNPYYQHSPVSTPERFKDFDLPFPMYLVTRLDGPTAQIAASLVDKAMEAERGIEKDSGIGYFDFRSVVGQYQSGDDSVKRAFEFCEQTGFRCTFNNQSQTGGMIRDAPDTLWAWGWYSGAVTRDVYRFKPGAVAAQLTSYSASSIRYPKGGAYVELFLRRGVTATWGATGEPYLTGFANGDNLLNHLWNGYNFAESSYIANPRLGWMMVFVGDPLYRPVFRKPDAAATGECAVNLTADARLFGLAGGDASVSVQTPEDCLWSIEQFETLEGDNGQSSWLLVFDKLGRGNGESRIAAPPNQSPNPRAASIQVGNRLAQFLQAGFDDGPPFPDVQADYPMVDAIRFIKNGGLALPCDHGRFCPESPLTRGDMAEQIVRAIFLGSPQPYYSSTPFFEDVPRDHPRFRYVQKLADLQLVHPCSTEPLLFCPGQTVTRGEFAEMLIRARMGDLFSAPQSDNFDDVPPGHPLYRYVQKIRDLGFTTGCGVRLYCPDAPVTRAQTAVFLSRVFLTPWEAPFF